jgi:hypothetical protein
VTWLAAHDHDVSALGPWEWVIVGAASIVAAWVIWKAVALTLHPGEEEPDHIKRTILQDEPPAAPPPPPDRGSDEE